MTLTLGLMGPSGDFQHLVLVIEVLDHKVDLGANAVRYSESFTFSRSEGTTRISLRQCMMMQQIAQQK